ncbi:SIMPL domain-containing protein [Cyclobacterium sp.]|uniref:SIMPL domain-containing protein n=1 Tax=Cyclobacterium sp. TaxID=1966343 RepID=UPI0019CE0385|nr:SIMPL domain-containing protein [Cyclobacterium sp.]MBD3630073.1 SIMPL domain-containing protein [Cyclobacterium sp.]
MKQIILFIFILLVNTFGAFAQKSNQIAVQGASEIKVMPDEVMLTVSLSEKAMKTAEVTAALNKKAKQVTNALEKSGVKGYEMTADNYFVNVNRIYIKGTTKDSGYVASQNLSILVKDTGEDLVKIIQALHEATDLGFQMEYRLSDEVKKTYREKLLQLAIADAKRKAEIIAASLNLTKVSVHQINYQSGSSIEPVVYRAESMRMKASDQYTPPTLSPDEQTLTDQINMIFTFEMEG